MEFMVFMINGALVFGLLFIFYAAFMEDKNLKQRQEKMERMYESANRYEESMRKYYIGTGKSESDARLKALIDKNNYLTKQRYIYD